MIIRDVLDSENHNKYGINDDYKEYEKDIENQILNLNNREYQEDEESSLCSCSSCLRKAHVREDFNTIWK